jgi:hypothetical protein
MSVLGPMPTFCDDGCRLDGLYTAEELRALADHMQPRTCAGCKHWTKYGNGPEDFWGACEQAEDGDKSLMQATNAGIGVMTRENFGCVMWEAKESERRISECPRQRCAANSRRN